MPSSISSSKHASHTSSLRAIAIAAVATFVIYAMLIALWPPNIAAGQDQQSDIAIAVERFLYDDAVPESAIVGSSQAQRVPATALGTATANLALAGQSPLTGLTLIARSGRIPRRIYVEINNVGNPADEAFLDSVFSEPGFTLKRFVKALRTTYQPANVLVSLLRHAARGRDGVYYPKIADQPFHAELVERQQHLLAARPDPVVVEQNLAEMKRLAEILSARGATLVFFEMPVDPQLEDAARVKAVRQAAHAALPPDQACWHNDAAPAGLPSTDGIHLDSDMAAAFWTGVATTRCGEAPAAGAMQQQR